MAAAQVSAAGVAEFPGLLAATFLMSLQLFWVAKASYVTDFYFLTTVAGGGRGNSTTGAGKSSGTWAHLRLVSRLASRVRRRLSLFAAFRTVLRLHSQNLGMGAVCDSQCLTRLAEIG